MGETVLATPEKLQYSLGPVLEQLLWNSFIEATFEIETPGLFDPGNV